VNRIALERRLSALALEVAALQPKQPDADNPFAWVAWLDNTDLRWVEGLLERRALGLEPTHEEQARWISLEAGAIVQMLAGAPDDITRKRAE
jgi:hypothetical protein